MRVTVVEGEPQKNRRLPAYITKGVPIAVLIGVQLAVNPSLREGSSLVVIVIIGGLAAIFGVAAVVGTRQSRTAVQRRLGHPTVQLTASYAEVFDAVGSSYERGRVVLDGKDVRLMKRHALLVLDPDGPRVVCPREGGVDHEERVSLPADCSIRIHANKGRAFEVEIQWNAGHLHCVAKGTLPVDITSR